MIHDLPDPSPTILSRRETEIAMLLAKGAGTYADIAGELNVSLETVRATVARIRNKTGLRQKQNIALWAYRRNEELDNHRRSFDV